MTLSEWCAQWLELYVRRQRKPKTLEGYSSTLRLHVLPALGGAALEQLTPEDVQQVINGLLDRCMSRTAQVVYTVLHCALARAVRSGHIARNVVGLIDKPSHVVRHGQAWNVEDQRLFVAAASGHRLWPAFALMLYAGLRRGEVLALTWPAIDLPGKVIHVRASSVRLKGGMVTGSPKSRAGVRDVPILPPLAAALRAHRRAAPWGASMAPVSDCTLSCTFARLQQAAGVSVPITLHGLRHTFATRSLQAGVSPKSLQYVLGHSSMALTVDLYSHAQFDHVAAEFASVASNF